MELKTSKWIPTLITFVFFSLSLYVYKKIEQSHVNAQKVAFHQQVEQHTQNIQFGFDQYIDITKNLGDALNGAVEVDTETLRSLSRTFQEKYPAIEFIMWNTESHHWITEPRVNEAVTLSNYTETLHQLSDRTNLKPVALPPEPDHDGRYLIPIVISFDKNIITHPSHLVIVLDLKRMIDSILQSNTTPGGLDITITAQGKPLYFHASRAGIDNDSDPLDWIEKNRITFAGLKWHLVATPSNIMYATNIDSIDHLPALLIAISGILFALFVQAKLTQQHAQKKQISELKSRDEHFKTMVNTIPGVVYRCNNDDEYSMTYISKAVEDVTGYAAKDFITHKISLNDLIHPEDKSKVKSVVEQVASTRKTFSIEYRIVRKNGEVRWVYERGQPVFDNEGTLLHLYGCLFDVTERILTDRKFRSLLESSPDMMVIIDSSGDIQFINERFCDVLGYSKEQLLGTNIELLVEEDFRDTHRKIKMEYMKKPIVTTLEERGDIKVLCQSGEAIPVEISLSPIGSDNGQLVCATMRDIRTRLAMETQLLTAKETAEAALEAKSAFLANMSHELRTPMNAIIGLSHLMKDSSMSPKQVEYNDKTIKSANHLLSIINNILDYSKLESHKLQLENISFSLRKMLQDISDIEGIQANDKGLDLNIHIDESVPSQVFGDPLRIKQVLLNLINNAIKFTEQGGIDLAVKAVALSSTAKEDDEHCLLEFSVKDTGVGISKDQITNIFNAFTQEDTSTARRFGGSGLGLSISAYLVELMGGKIHCESVIGHGSTFTFQAQFVIDTQAIGSDSAPLPLSVPDLSNYRVLLVEDNEINQLVANEMLLKTGIQVRTACDGGEAIGILSLEEFDIVLMDCQMPVMDGYEATQYIRNIPHLAQLPIVALTANTLPEEINLMFDVGMNDHISKPIEPEILYSKLAKWLPDTTSMPEERNTTETVLPTPIFPTEESHLEEQFLNRQMILEFASNNMAVVTQILDAFLSNFATDMSAIQKAIADSNRVELSSIAHKFKGISSYMGSAALTSESKALEYAAHGEQWEHLEQQVRHWLEHIQQLHSEIEAWNNELNSEE